MWIFATAVFLVLVFFLYRHPRTTLKVLGIVAALLGGVIIYLYNQPVSQSTYVDRDSKVLVHVVYDPATCSEAYPLRVIINNGADKTLERVEWQMAAFVTGRSSNIAKYQLNPYVSDHIVDPNMMVRLCYKVPLLEEPQQPSQLRWEAELPRVSFRY